MQKVTYGNIVIIVRRATIGDDLRSQKISRKLTDKAPDGQWGMWPAFADLSSHVFKSKGLPFDPLTLDALDDIKLEAAYVSFLGLDKGLMDKWREAVMLADRPAEGDMSIEALPEGADPNL